ncbi:hypothetical protein CCO03_16730 [Comamonas serinivorans]|uniref:OmpA-like domain-containing protein n=1 Tax=Comamonas serinivorans TaxID=1082851 RepID=A0A1Y0ER08_9BURK|nr:YidB family protein [Comamonas serinivorans]ARU06094.1 hypothetical protein CCO03_16730 [Comamonas serinivorans]
MFDILIRELAARFGIGDKSSELLRIVLAYMTHKETGGLTGFLERFKAAGLGPIVQSWLGNTVSPKPLNNTQVEAVLGGSGGLLDLLSHHINAPRDNLAGAVAYLIPGLVAKLTPGGSIPSGLPATVTGFIGDAQPLLARPVAASAAGGGGGGLAKWLPWLIGAVVLLLGLSYCSQKGDAPPADGPAQTAPASGASDAASAPAAAGAPDAASDAASGATTPADAPAAAASAAALPASDGAVVLASMPEGAAVVAGEAHGVPLLQVFFDSGKVDVATEFAARSSALVAYLKANADAKAVVSGFNDPTGDPAKNAELSKQRAQAVQAALVAQGIAQDRTVLEKPVDPTGTGISNAAARRVDVVVRP